MAAIVISDDDEDTKRSAPRGPERKSGPFGGGGDSPAPSLGELLDAALEFEQNGGAFFGGGAPQAPVADPTLAAGPAAPSSSGPSASALPDHSSGAALHSGFFLSRDDDLKLAALARSAPAELLHDQHLAKLPAEISHLILQFQGQLSPFDATPESQWWLGMVRSGAHVGCGRFPGDQRLAQHVPVEPIGGRYVE